FGASSPICARRSSAPSRTARTPASSAAAARRATGLRLRRRHRASGVGLEDADERQVAVALRVIEAVADDELIGDREAEIIDRHVLQAPLGLVEERADLDALRLPRLQIVEEVADGQPGVDDVLAD